MDDVSYASGSHHDSHVGPAADLDDGAGRVSDHGAGCQVLSACYAAHDQAVRCCPLVTLHTTNGVCAGQSLGTITGRIGWARSGPSAGPATRPTGAAICVVAALAEQDGLILRHQPGLQL
jgi:hypothetical protein